VCGADGRLKLLASANTAVQLAEQQMGKRVPGPTASPPKGPRRRRLYNQTNMKDVTTWTLNLHPKLCVQHHILQRLVVLETSMLLLLK
jgi:hypothetical protein